MMNFQGLATLAFNKLMSSGSPSTQAEKMHMGSLHQEFRKLLESFFRRSSFLVLDIKN